MQLKTIATLLATGIAVSIGVPALAAISRTNVKPSATTSSRYISGGTEDNGRTTLYICSAVVDGEYTPGKYYPPNGRCYVAWGGKEYSYTSSYLYTANSWTWGNFPGYTVGNNPSGGTENNGKNKLYFCQARVDGEYTPGKYYPPNKTCYVSWGGREYRYKSNFKILFVN